MQNAKIVICASGGGSNFEAIVQASRQGGLHAQVVGLIANRQQAGVIARAERLQVPYKILAPREFSTPLDWDQAMVSQLRQWQADWVVLAGFLVLIGPQVLATFAKRVVNSHPALLPKFGGPGMYGLKVHAAVLAAGESVSGVTIHLADAEYDRGQILAQQQVALEPSDTIELLSARVKALEISFYPKVLNDLVTNRITIS